MKKNEDTETPPLQRTIPAYEKTFRVEILLPGRLIPAYAGQNIEKGSIVDLTLAEAQESEARSFGKILDALPDPRSNFYQG